MPSGDCEEDPEQPLQLCTFAVTGPANAFQAIYVCYSCTTTSGPVNNESEDTDTTTSKSAAVLCVCAACAERCHGDHDVNYIGMGPSYCDCREHAMQSCRIAIESHQHARGLGIAASAPQPPTTVPSLPSQLPQGSLDESSSTESPSSSPNYIRHVYQIRGIKETAKSSTCLAQQAHELVRHSRDTFWLDHENEASTIDTDWCDLERVAHMIYRRHVSHYFPTSAAANARSNGTAAVAASHENSEGGTNGSSGGAEWWVQVKPVVVPNPQATNELIAAAANITSADNDAAPCYHQEAAVDLHYDKDEVLAEAFGLGYFPSLSTVTYLTDHVTAAAAPTLVFSRCYNQDEDDEPIAEVLACRPVVGQHLVFDGRLLHGAPSHPALRQQQQQPVDNESAHRATTTTEPVLWRITLLVNVWRHYKPAGVHPLPPAIRQAMQQNAPCRLLDVPWRRREAPNTALDDDDDDDEEWFTDVSWQTPTVCINQESDLPEAWRCRIALPFVGGQATWGGGNDDDESATVLVTYPPPPIETPNGAVLVRFGPGMQAYLQQQNSEPT
jgi:hypothetical protein